MNTWTFIPIPILFPIYSYVCEFHYWLFYHKTSLSPAQFRFIKEARSQLRCERVVTRIKETHTSGVVAID